MAVPSTSTTSAAPTSTTDLEDPANDDDGASSPRLLALAYGGGQLAGALYEPASMTARLMHDTPDLPPTFAQLFALISQVQPDQVITSGRQDERFLCRVRELLLAEAADEEDSRLHLQPPGDYRADNCRHRVMAIQLPCEPPGDDQTHYNFITSRIDFSQTTAIRALGGLLRYLDRRPLETLTRQPIMRLETLVLDDIMHVSGGAFRTLQVFSSDRHPSSFKAETTREGLSIFAILNKCSCPLGVGALRRLLLQPLTNRALIEQRLDAVEFFTRPDSDDVLQSLNTCLKKVKNLTPMMSRLRNCRPLAGDWRSLYDTLCGCVVIGEICRDLPSTVTLFRKMADEKRDDVQQLLHALHATVNFEESRELRRFSVNLGLDETLDGYKQMYAGLRDLLSSEMAAEQEKLPEVIQLCSMVFLPQMGFLIMVEEWTEEVPPERWRSLPGLRFQFEDRGKVLFKSARCDTLDSEVGDVATAIRDRETQVMVRLSERVLEAAEEVHRLTSLCGLLDAVISLARSAVEFNYTRPKFVAENVIELRQSRHPLLELCSDTVVPNDFTSSGEHGCDRVKLVTGANGGGKSIYLRQVGLTVLMAHCGSFVPASAVRLGVQHHLATVFPPATTGCGSGSALLAELRQLCAALAQSGPRALLMLDEFGGGTLAEDGAALLAAALTELLNRRDACPHALVSTHIHRLSSLLPPSQLLTPVYPELVAEPGDQHVTFLYQMTTGTAGKSYALAAARLACLPEKLIQRADQVTKAFVSGERISPDEELKQQQNTVIQRSQKAVQTFLMADLDSEQPEDVLQLVYDDYMTGLEDVEDYSRSVTGETPMSAFWATPVRTPTADDAETPAGRQPVEETPSARRPVGGSLNSGGILNSGGSLNSGEQETSGISAREEATPANRPAVENTPVCGPSEQHTRLTGPESDATAVVWPRDSRTTVGRPRLDGAGEFAPAITCEGQAPNCDLRTHNNPSRFSGIWMERHEGSRGVRDEASGMLSSYDTSTAGRYIYRRAATGVRSHTIYTSSSDEGSVRPRLDERIESRDQGIESRTPARVTSCSTMEEEPHVSNQRACGRPFGQPSTKSLTSTDSHENIPGNRFHGVPNPFVSRASQGSSIWPGGSTQGFGRNPQPSDQREGSLHEKRARNEVPFDPVGPKRVFASDRPPESAPSIWLHESINQARHDQDQLENRPRTQDQFTTESRPTWSSTSEWSTFRRSEHDGPTICSAATAHDAGWSAVSERPIGCQIQQHSLHTTTGSEVTERPISDRELTAGSKHLLAGSWLNAPATTGAGRSADHPTTSGSDLSLPPSRDDFSLLPSRADLSLPPSRADLATDNHGNVEDDLRSLDPWFYTARRGAWSGEDASRLGVSESTEWPAGRSEDDLASGGGSWMVGRQFKRARMDSMPEESAPFSIPRINASRDNTSE